ncbi:MAG: hypothetical protein LUF29_06945 [Oscillospiraceae bacterium]|nr:hypothetical protein [Oscillospiraceae bacterium]
MKRRIFAIVLAVLMITALVGCGGSSREIVYLTLSSEDSEAILAAAGITLPDAADVEVCGTTIKWFSWYDDGDGIYYLNATPTGYMICMGAGNPEGVALLASCERFKVIDPTVVDIDKKQLKETYLWTDEMLEMVDICNQLVLDNTIMYYTGDLGSNLNSAYNRFDWGINRSGGGSTWAQLKESYSDMLDFYIEELNYIVDNYIETGEFAD